MMMVNILTFYMCSFWRWWKLKTMIFLVKYDARFLGDHRGRDRMVVGFTTTFAISAYHHKRYEFECHSWRGLLDTLLCNKVCQ